MATITLSFNDINTSVQVGDVVYYSPSIQNYQGSGFDYSTIGAIKKLGIIVGGNNINEPITRNSITVQYDDAIVGPPPAGSFISFAKEKKVNTSSLIGYYADIKFANNSKEKVELFSVG